MALIVAALALAVALVCLWTVRQLLALVAAQQQGPEETPTLPPELRRQIDRVFTTHTTLARSAAVNGSGHSARGGGR